MAEADRAEWTIWAEQLGLHLRLHRRRWLARVPNHQAVALELVVAEQRMPVLEALLGVLFGEPFRERLVGLELGPLGLTGVERFGLGLTRRAVPSLPRLEPGGPLNLTGSQINETSPPTAESWPHGQSTGRSVSRPVDCRCP
jgi:hypothetical protein